MILPAPPAGKLRYLVSGLAFSFLAGAVLHAFRQLAGAGGAWRSFSGKCLSAAPQGEKTLLLVQFRDARGLMHQAAFFSQHPAARRLSAGDAVCVSVALPRWQAGTLPCEPADAAGAGRDILLRQECRSFRLRALGRELLRQGICCGAALLLFRAAMRWCFPV